MTLEAIMLHYLDNLDAKIQGVQQFLKKQVSESSRFSRYHPFFEQYFYVPATTVEMQAPDMIEGKDQGEE
jgi:3'-5' exoribonuclease